VRGVSRKLQSKMLVNSYNLNSWEASAVKLSIVEIIDPRSPSMNTFTKISLHHLYSSTLQLPNYKSSKVGFFFTSVWMLFD
jgi:hypothetical protein